MCWNSGLSISRLPPIWLFLREVKICDCITSEHMRCVSFGLGCCTNGWWASLLKTIVLIEWVRLHTLSSCLILLWCMTRLVSLTGCSLLVTTCQLSTHHHLVLSPVSFVVGTHWPTLHVLVTTSSKFVHYSLLWCSAWSVQARFILWSTINSLIYSINDVGFGSSVVWWDALVLSRLNTRVPMSIPS